MQRLSMMWIFATLVSLSCPDTFGADQDARIFDGQTLGGWTTFDGRPITKGWEVVDGMIHLDPSADRTGHIVTAEEYGDFDLQFEWKIATGGNSGIKYRVREFGSRALGCEYQILDDVGYPRTLKPKGLTGALYDVYEANSAKYLKPAGQFNHGRIIVCGQHIEHWLNGRLIVLAEVGSSEWHRRIADSKFADVEGFGQNRYGKIMLTAHGSEVWYRNIDLRRLQPLADAPLQTVVDCRPPRRRAGGLRGFFNLLNLRRTRCR